MFQVEGGEGPKDDRIALKNDSGWMRRPVVTVSAKMAFPGSCAVLCYKITLGNALR